MAVGGVLRVGVVVEGFGCKVEGSAGVVKGVLGVGGVFAGLHPDTLGEAGVGAGVSPDGGGSFEVEAF